jgi:uncharacterized protein (TIGR02246 family)
MLRLASSALVLVGMTLGTAQAFAEEADVLQQAKDRAEIEALMWRYARALDTYDEDAYASVYTEGGQFAAGSNVTKGREALRNMIVGFEEGSAARTAAGEPAAPMYHMTANHHIEFLGADRARLHSYWITVFGAAGEDTPLRVAAAGRGVDELVRVDGEWLIESRNVAPQD